MNNSFKVIKKILYSVPLRTVATCTYTGLLYATHPLNFILSFVHKLFFILLNNDFQVIQKCTPNLEIS